MGLIEYERKQPTAETLISSFQYRSGNDIEEYSIFRVYPFSPESSQKGFTHPTNAQYIIRDDQGKECGLIEGELNRPHFPFYNKVFYSEWIKNETQEKEGGYRKHLIQEAVVNLLTTRNIDIIYSSNIHLGPGISYYQNLTQDSRLLVDPPNNWRPRWKVRARR